MDDGRFTRDLDRTLMTEAYTYAMERATDPSTQNGAILVNDRGDVLAGGANHFPLGVDESAERWERPEKYKWVEHAERNAIYDAARRGVATGGLIMVCPWAACADCARAIIQAGIVEVVTHRIPDLDENGFVPGNGASRWEESIKVARTMFREARVSYRWIEDKLDATGRLTVRRDGKAIHP